LKNPAAGEINDAFLVLFEKLYFIKKPGAKFNIFFL